MIRTIFFPCYWLIDCYYSQSNDHFWTVGGCCSSAHRRSIRSVMFCKKTLLASFCKGCRAMSYLLLELENWTEWRQQYFSATILPLSVDISISHYIEYQQWRDLFLSQWCSVSMVIGALTHWTLLLSSRNRRLVQVNKRKPTNKTLRRSSFQLRCDIGSC